MISISFGLISEIFRLVMKFLEDPHKIKKYLY